MTPGFPNVNHHIDLGGPTVMSKQRLSQLALIVLTAMTSVFIASIVQAQPSGAANDLTFNPLTPCAVFDTRPGAPNIGGITGPVSGGPNTFTVTGTCGVPAGAAAIELNLVAVNPTGNGNVKIAANGATPGGGVVNFYPGETNSNAIPVDVANNQIDIYVNNGPTNVRGVILGYYTNTLKQRLDALENEDADIRYEIILIQELLDGLTRETVDGYDTLRLTGVNLQLIDGTGSTYGTPNGYGNLIIGYNDNVTDTRTGSHNIIVGDQHSYTHNGTILFGYNNTTSNNGTSVTGGQSNTAQGIYSSITGGVSNTVNTNGASATITGGGNNTAGGDGATITGGNTNTVNNNYASVTGGHNNTAAGLYSSVTGGLNNTASSIYSSVTGGLQNQATQQYSSVTGGFNNTASASGATVSGGVGRTEDGDNHWTGGSSNNDG